MQPVQVTVQGRSSLNTTLGLLPTKIGSWWITTQFENCCVLLLNSTSERKAVSYQNSGVLQICMFSFSFICPRKEQAAVAMLITKP